MLEKKTNFRNHLKDMDNDVFFLKPSLPAHRSARKILFYDEAISEEKPNKDQFVQRLVDDFIVPRTLWYAIFSVNLFIFNKEDSENKNPLGEISDTVIRRRTSGILVCYFFIPLYHRSVFSKLILFRKYLKSISSLESSILPTSEGSEKLAEPSTSNLSNCDDDLENSRRMVTFHRRRLKDSQRQDELNMQSAMAHLDLS
uniref:Uncharacterized protein n=1 Tax=Heterorhabditis bacteriophora TaxID=37862 RepID=A0A1I7WNV3_HETBA